MMTTTRIYNGAAGLTVTTIAFYGLLSLAQLECPLAEQAVVQASDTARPEIVFSYPAEKCDDLDLPDSNLRAFRRYDGTVVAFSTHYVNRALFGSSLGHLQHDCNIVYQGGHNPDPSKFDDRTWVASTWTDDGRLVAGLGHNEYQAERFLNECQYRTYAQCWYNAVVLLLSTNGGSAFSRADTKAARPLVAAPFRNEVAQGHPRGYFEPTNVVGSGGYHYVLIAQRGLEKGGSGRCLFRSRNPYGLDDWAYFDGQSFVPSAGSPYDGDLRRSDCKLASGLRGTLGSIARIRGSDLFAGFTIYDHADPEKGGAIGMSVSNDLLSWTGRQEVINLPTSLSKSCPGGFWYAYPSVLDDSDTGFNFDSVGQEGWLFLIRMNCKTPRERELVRFRVHLDIRGSFRSE